MLSLPSDTLRDSHALSLRWSVASSLLRRYATTQHRMSPALARTVVLESRLRRVRQIRLAAVS